MSFRQLIKEQYDLRTPYILVQVTTLINDKTYAHYFDAHQFNIYYFVEYGAEHRYPLADNLSNQMLYRQNRTYNQEYKNIINNAPLTSHGINYFINSLENPTKFTYLCCHANLFPCRDKCISVCHLTMMANQNQDLKLRAQKQSLLGCYYTRNWQGSSEDDKKAHAIFSAIDLEQLRPDLKADVQYKLGIMHHLGLGTKQDDKQAYAILSAIDLTQLPPNLRARVQYRLGIMYSFGKGVQNDDNQAFALLSKIELAELPPRLKADAQYELSEMYQEGRGVQKNYKKAFDLRSAIDLEQLSPDKKAFTQSILGRMYLYSVGKEMPQSRRKARFVFCG